MLPRAAAAALALTTALWAAAPGAAAADTAAAQPPAEPVAPGVALTQTSAPGSDPGSGSGSATHFSTLNVDLSGPAAVGYLGGGHLTDPAPVSAMPAPAGTVAAVNGDFFDSGASGAPLGAAVSGGTLLKSPTRGRANTAVIGAWGRGGIHRAEFSGTAGLPGADIGIDRLNSHRIPADGTGVFTAAWGDHPRSRAAGSGPVTELVVSEGTVRKVRESAGTGTIAPGTRVLLGRGAAAERLAGLGAGARVSLDYALDTGGLRAQTAIGGRNVLLRDGETTGADDGARHPRTAIGFSRDGRRMFLVVADGRARGTRGATLPEVAERLRRAGADDALELDGGGSATLLTRAPGTDGLELRNRAGEPERAVPNGLSVRAPRGDGTARGVWVQPAVPARPPRGSALPVRPDPHRVFTGLGRELTARAYDSAYGPAPEPGLSWTARGGGVEGSGGGAVFRAGAPGGARVEAGTGGARGGVDLEVLPGPQRLAATPAALAFSGGSGRRSFVIDGVAPDGTRAAIEPADAEITVEPDLAAITRRGDASVLVEPTAASGTATITVAAGGRSVDIPLRIGSQPVELAGFADAAEWDATGYRAAAAEVSPAAGHTGGGLALDYDFTGERRSRAAYAVPPAPLAVERTAFGFGLQVRGDGNGAQVALTVVGADGRRHSCYGPRVDWTGWRKAAISVPDGIAHPVSVERIYLVETRSDHQYRGRVVIDDLRATAAAAPDAARR
ncbi:hypothetical protein GCM10027570_20170 [Streptomonospora sediminis]